MRKKNAITEREKVLLLFVVDYIKENHYAPSVREIMTGLGIRSSSTVQMRLQSLKFKKLIDFEDSMPRTIVVNYVDYSMDTEKLMQRLEEMKW